MSSPALIYLNLADILGIYEEIFFCTQQEAADQLRNEHGLHSALARAETYAHYQSADIATQAAVIAHGIAEGQPFIDGNKRTALAAMRTFLLVNGYQVNASQTDRAQWILDFSDGLTVEQLAERIRRILRTAS